LPPRISRAIAQTRRARSPVFSLASAACSIETRPRACNCDVRVHINCITDADPVLVDVKPREQEIAPYIRPVSQQRLRLGHVGEARQMQLMRNGDGLRRPIPVLAQNQVSFTAAWVVTLERIGPVQKYDHIGILL